jgi:hypothetical protein
MTVALDGQADVNSIDVRKLAGTASRSIETTSLQLGGDGDRSQKCSFVVHPECSAADNVPGLARDQRGLDVLAEALGRQMMLRQQPKHVLHIVLPRAFDCHGHLTDPD